MSYQVLARKWRPRNFSEMAGQEHVLQALINALDNDRLHHAYLFTGTRGVGKTTIARILAKCLNCEQGVSSVPCGECSSCKAIAEGRFVDLLEVDAASRTKVEDTRELLENVQYAPTAGRYKVYLIDEVHMLSSHSFNALLKTLEEPPPHIKFLLATTDPQKLPVTILSRCLQFNLKNLSPERIVEHLRFVLGEEKVPFEEAGLWSLARAADGSMRDALSLTDQAIAHGGGQLTDNEVNGMLGTIALSSVIDICKTLASRDGAQVLSVVAHMAEHAPDYSAALGEILSVWHRVAIAQTVPDALDNRQGDYQAILALAGELSREDVQLFYQIALLGRRDLPLAADYRSGFEMVLLRMLAFQPTAESRIDPPSGAASVPQAVETQVAQQSAPQEKGSQQNVPQEAVASVKKPEAHSVAAAAEQPGIDSPATPMADKARSAIPETQSEPPAARVCADSDRASAKATGTASEVANVPPELPLKQAVQSSSEPVFSEIEPPPFDGYDEEDEPAPISDSALQQLSHRVHQQTQGNANATVVETTAASTTATNSTVASYSLDQASPENWIEIYRGLKVAGIIQNIASNLVLVERRGSDFRFQLDINNSSLYEASHQSRLSAVLSEYFAEPVSLEIEVAQLTAETPMANASRLAAERQAEAIDLLNNDPHIGRMVERFDGRLLEETVKPIN